MDEPEDIEMSGDLLEDSEMVDSMLELDGFRLLHPFRLERTW